MMMNKPKFVLDANVLVSATLFSRSSSRRALDYAQDVGIILISEATFGEIQEVLQRPKFDRYLSRERREELLQRFLVTAQLVEITETVVDCRDPKDNKYLELALSGRADAVITGDQDLLVLNPFRGIAIMTISEFLDTPWA
jgi:uncharacterized protein